ncbi:Protein ROH1A [Cardamine amara subsp. amara]|uniref:Protein ROH1A n=1 Tax=Cardamine amara subsp. amara TaxID=228776 RepID=A0ABD1BZJ8_CARAN
MAPATEFQGSFLSRISIRRNQIVSMDVNHEQELEELDYFQKHVAERFSDLLSSPSPPSSSSDAVFVSQPSDPILSIPWLQNLLDVFMSCEAEFKAVLSTTQISKSPVLERVLPEMLDRILKALDICNAVVYGIDSVRQSRRLAEIAVTALKQRPLCDGSVRRAKRALTRLLVGLNADGRDRSGCSSNRRTTSRSWSFGQRSNVTVGGGGSSGHVSKNCSAAKQIQAMVSNLVVPRGAEASGPAMPVYIMSSVMVLVMWVLVAAVPCQTSSVLVAPLSLPKHQSWASATVSIQERIGEEMKRKEKRCGGGGGGGLMEEMQRMERIGLSLMEFAEKFRFPAEEEEEEEVAEKVDELEEICRRMEVGLEDLQGQVRQVFHRLVRSRIEIVSVLDQAPAI